MDLLDFFRGVHSWRRLAVLIEGLPRRARLTLAQADDEELAEQYAEQLESQRPGPPPLDEYGPVEQRLDRLTVAMESLTVLVASALGGKPRQPTIPRQPETAADRVRRRAYERRMQSLESEVLAAQRRYQEATE